MLRLLPFRWLRLAIAALAACSTLVAAQTEQSCYGRFPNPITDICWMCIFPISIGAAGFAAGQIDIENPPSPVCLCPTESPPYVRIGLSVGFWEPTRIIESTRTPYCFPALDGTYLSGQYAPPHGRNDQSPDRKSRDSFYQAHLYANPILYYVEGMNDGQCEESGSIDLMYMSEYDPMWHDDELTALIEPEAILFANALAQLACAADCVAATLDFGLLPLIWCDGCNGPVYPMNGNVPVHIGGIQAASLINHRLLEKMHRLGISWQWHGPAALCGGYPQTPMDKRGYKTQLIYPIPATLGSDPTRPDVCCQPLGHTTQAWGMGREYPVKGEDFAFQVFRKRNCCMQ